MTLEQLWEKIQCGERAEALAPLAAGAEEWFYLAMAACRTGDAGAAAAFAGRAAALDPGHAVYGEAARRLRAGRREDEDVYAEPEAFSAFVRGGGNVGLYRAVHEALREQYSAHRPAHLLDIGCGEGHALLPALTADVGHVELIEPSARRLDLVTAELTRRGVPHRGHAATAQSVVAGAGPWDLVQETFSLLALEREERRDLLRRLRPRAKRLALVEFDAPDLGEGLAPDRFRYLVSRYDRGIREYGPERELVAQGFLMPVLLGLLGSEEHQRHHEQPVARWVEDLEHAGFTPGEPRRLYDYWWAPAYLLTAS
ncbi:class I SAM-dependent methyltransferase [Streptomyces cinnamoneus]|uniref:class I SAM-dependent methyltransferase n=1 Tax=Streptomyces cinnamoneus TaxID=53446 RepID=UPI000D1BC720|nr:class I SAM-dependent methyltransferase [Streptomyces cinnamoneus]